MGILSTADIGNWLFSFIKAMLRQAERQDAVKVVCGQIGSPIYAADLAPLLCDMDTAEKYGTCRAANEGYCSRAEFGQDIFRPAGKSGT